MFKNYTEKGIAKMIQSYKIERKHYTRTKIEKLNESMKIVKHD